MKVRVKKNTSSPRPFSAKGEGKEKNKKEVL
jgi:hypothetical protein